MRLALFGWVLVATAVNAQDAVSSARRTATAEGAGDSLPSGSTHGVTFPITFSTEVLGNLTGGRTRTAIWESLLRVGLEIDFEEAAGIKGLSLTVNGIYAQGSGLTSEAVEDFNTLSNIDSYDSPRVYEFWLQQDFAGGKFSIRFGQILADAEFFASEGGAIFLNSSFGAIPLVSKNLDPPIFPVAAPGVRLRISPGNSFYAEAAVFSGDAGEPSTANKHNLRFSFRGDDGVLVFAEIGYRINPRNKSPALPSDSDASGNAALTGTYKFGGYYDSAEFVDRADGSPHQGDYACYFIADQELWHPDGQAARTLSYFARFGAAPNDRNVVTLYGDTGFNFRGLCARRLQDTLGLGFSYAQLSSALREASGRPIESHHEAVLELTYRAAFGDHLSLQPDLQFIFNPGAVAPAATAITTGLRLNLNF